MRKRWVCALALASWAAGGFWEGLAAEVVRTGQRYPVKKTMIACIERSDFERFVPLAASGDVAAFDRLRNDLIGAMRCADLAAGFDVYVDDVDRGRACLRVPAATRCLWTTVKAVEP